MSRTQTPDSTSDADWVTVGPVVLLQVQRQALTGGEPNIYRPEPLLEVERLVVDAHGVSTEVDGAVVLDVHHASHPDGGRFTPDRALSIGFTAHYDAMETRFGDAPLGIAGENVIVRSDRVITQADVAGGLRITHADGTVSVLDRAKVAAPCAMFTRYLRGSPDATVEEIADDRAFLHRGIRGFVLRVDHRGDGITIEPGASVAIRLASDAAD